MPYPGAKERGCKSHALTSMVASLKYSDRETCLYPSVLKREREATLASPILARNVCTPCREVHWILEYHHVQRARLTPFVRQCSPRWGWQSAAPTTYQLVSSVRHKHAQRLSRQAMPPAPFLRDHHLQLDKGGLACSQGQRVRGFIVWITWTKHKEDVQEPYHGALPTSISAAFGSSWSFQNRFTSPAMPV